MTANSFAYCGSIGEVVEMELSNQSIMFFTRTMQLGGTENVILQLCEVLQPQVNKIVVCSCGGVNVDKLTSMGIKHYIIPDIENKLPMNIARTMKDIYTIIKREKITIIHTHHRMAAFYVAVLGLYKKCHFINTSHNTFYDKKGFTRFAYKHAMVIACGDMVKQNLVQYYNLPNDQVKVVHNAVKPFINEINIDPFIKTLHDSGCFVIGNIGRLSQQKGYEYYINSIPEVVLKHNNVRFLIVGTGEDEDKLKKQVDQLGLEDFVFFIGYRNDIQNYMSQLDLIVLSSLWEGLPLTPIEAFSVSKTVIGTNVDGTPEIIEDGLSGLLVEAKNERQLASKINWLIDHPEDKKRMEMDAKRRYEQEFSFEKLAERYIYYYKNLEKY